MSLVSDIQYKLAHVPVATVTLAAGTITNSATAAIDTKGFNAISVGLALSRALAGNDALTYKFQQSDNGSTGWTDVPANGNLPYSAAGVVQTPNSPYVQNVGCFSSNRYVRVVFNGTVETTQIVVTPYAVLEDRIREQTRNSTAGLPTDGQP